MATDMRRADVHQPPRLVSVEEAARLLGIGRTLAWGMVYRGQLKTIRLGKRVLVPQAEVDRIAAGEEG
jgi:excisionase family DNA binding protein